MINSWEFQGGSVDQYGSRSFPHHYQNRLVFPSKGDRILDHTVSHSMSEDELTSLLGYKIQKASETYKQQQNED